MLGGYIVNLCVFYFYRIIGKLTTFLHPQEFNFRDVTVDCSTSTTPCSRPSSNLRSTRSHMSSHLVYPETYDLCLGPSGRTTSLFRGQCLFFTPPRVMEFIIFSVIFLIYLALSPISLSCGTFRVSPSSRFTHFCVLRPLCSLLVFLFWDLHIFHYQCLFLSCYIYSDLYFLYRTRQLKTTNVLFWRDVDMYIYLLICTMTEKKKKM
jgi:hypothetical protein